MFITAWKFTTSLHINAKIFYIINKFQNWRTKIKFSTIAIPTKATVFPFVLLMTIAVKSRILRSLLLYFCHKLPKRPWDCNFSFVVCKLTLLCKHIVRGFWGTYVANKWMKMNDEHRPALLRRISRLWRRHIKLTYTYLLTFLLIYLDVRSYRRDVMLCWQCP